MSGAYTPQVQETIIRLGSRLPSAEARDELAMLWGVKISSGSVRHITLRHGQIADELIGQEVARLEKEAPTPTVKPKQLIMSADRAMVQLTSGEWREVKTVAFGEFASCWDAKNKDVVTTTENISYFSRVATAEAFANTALYEWQRRGGENTQQVVAVNDGAPFSFMYLVAIMDWFSRYIIAWQLSNSLDGAFCLEALRSALQQNRPEIFNTDQGSQFTAHAFTDELEHAGIRVSMDGRGRFVDNIFVERLWRTVKYENIYIKEYATVPTLFAGLTDYFHLYNY